MWSPMLLSGIIALILALIQWEKNKKPGSAI